MTTKQPEAAKFTSGPWTLGREGSPMTPMSRNRVWPPGGRAPICQLSSFGSQPADLDPEAQANGLLIAEAPAMYDVVRKVAGQRVDENAACHVGICTAEKCVRCSKIMSARAILARIEGRTP